MFCDDDAPVRLMSFALPGNKRKALKPLESPDRVHYGTSLATCRSGSGSSRSLVSQQSKWSDRRKATVAICLRGLQRSLSCSARQVEGVNLHEFPSSFSVYMRDR